MRLDVGSVIAPGNWGRIIRTMYPAPHNNHIALPYREAVFEYARMTHAPEKISRLSCLFVCPTLESAIQFRNAHQQSNIVYEVEPTGDTARMHTADSSLANFPQQGQYFEWIFDAARRYWLALDIQNPEILMPCPVRVVGTPEGLRNLEDLPGSSRTDGRA
jgi:hypothetical protein